MGIGCPECKGVGYHDDWCPNHPTRTGLAAEIEDLGDEVSAWKAKYEDLHTENELLRKVAGAADGWCEYLEVHGMGMDLISALESWRAYGKGK